MSESPTQLATMPAAKQSQLSRPSQLDVLALPFEQMWKFCTHLAQGELGKGFKNDPTTMIAAMQFGAEIGLNWSQSLSSIMVVNGKPSLYGDSMLGLCKVHPDWHEKDFKEAIQGAGDAMIAYCQVRRGTAEPTLQSFSVADAKVARLWGKDGPWTTNPRRMLQMRARSFALRDAFPDVIKGLLEAESQEAQPIEHMPSRTLAESIRNVLPLETHDEEKMRAEHYNKLEEYDKRIAEGAMNILNNSPQPTIVAAIPMQTEQIQTTATG